MTSTEFTVGLEGGRNSSKVLKPPGGGSSDIFGLGGSAPCQKKDEKSTKNRLFGSEPVQANGFTPRKNQSNVFGTDSAALTQSAKKAYVRRNPITGEGIDCPENEKTESSEKENEDENIKAIESEKADVVETKAEPPKVIQTSIRVRNPPGGKSSGIF